MITMYSRRLLLPYVGMIQVADMGPARALSLDGKNWAIRYLLSDTMREKHFRLIDDPRLNYSLVATIINGQLKTQAIHPILDLDSVRTAIRELFEAVVAADVPFVAADHYEYWLLDSDDDSPLALLYSTMDKDELNNPPPRPEWMAIPAAELKVQDPQPQSQYDSYVPPVNYRLQKLVEERAGSKPRATWYERLGSTAEDFPPCLLREDWETESQQQLCDRYIRRIAPRLLMIQGLPRPVRHRLEQAAREYVFDVERFYPLYPEVINHNLLTAARVEARLRRANR